MPGSQAERSSGQARRQRVCVERESLAKASKQVVEQPRDETGARVWGPKGRGGFAGFGRVWGPAGCKLGSHRARGGLDRLVEGRKRKREGRHGVEDDTEIGHGGICADGTGDGHRDDGRRYRSKLQLVSAPGVAQAGLRKLRPGHPRAQLGRCPGALQSTVMEQCLL